MIIALDYDECFTEDKVFWSGFVASAKKSGHTVTFVTYRPDRWHDSTDILADADTLGIETVFTAGQQKAGLFKADIWIDDSPVTIPVAEDLGNMYDGCLINNDMRDNYGEK